MASENVQTITDGNFEDTVLKASQPVLVDFWAEWCGRARAWRPVDALAAEWQAGSRSASSMWTRIHTPLDASVSLGSRRFCCSRWADRESVVGLADKITSAGIRPHLSVIEPHLIMNAPRNVSSSVRGPLVSPQPFMRTRANLLALVIEGLDAAAAHADDGGRQLSGISGRHHGA